MNFKLHPYCNFVFGNKKTKKIFGKMFVFQLVLLEYVEKAEKNQKKNYKKC